MNMKVMRQNSRQFVGAKFAGPPSPNIRTAHLPVGQGEHNGDVYGGSTFTLPSRSRGSALPGMLVALASVPLAIAARSPALAVVGGVVGLALAFGSDE